MLRVLLGISDLVTLMCVLLYVFAAFLLLPLVSLVLLVFLFLIHIDFVVAF